MVFSVLQIGMTYSFAVGVPNVLGILLFVGQDQLGEKIT